MKFSDNAMSAVLLCSYIGLGREEEVKPFSLGEWNAFLERLSEAGKEPGIVLEPELETLVKMQFPDALVERVRLLVSRGGNVAFGLDELDKKGIGVVTLFDSDYPVLMKRKLKKKVPPVLFFAGDIQLAKKVGIAIVGSRNVDQSGIQFTEKLAEKAAKEKMIIYSGGAKGVDTISETVAVREGGAAVCFLADSLLARIKKKEVMNAILQGRLLLISDMKPEAGFTSARAMNRNKYIYASAYAAFVVASDYNQGGTWSGAMEALRNTWSKVFVWNHKEYAGNQKLLEKGGIAYDLSADKLYDMITRKEQKFEQLDLFAGKEDFAAGKETEEEIKEITKNSMYESGKESFWQKDKKMENIVKNDADGTMEDLYHCVKDYLVEHLAMGMDADEAAVHFNVAKGQMVTWLKRLREDQLVKYEAGVYSTR